MCKKQSGTQKSYRNEVTLMLDWKQNWIASLISNFTDLLMTSGKSFKPHNTVSLSVKQNGYLPLIYHREVDFLKNQLFYKGKLSV